MAPIKVAVFPLVKNKPELMKKARGIYETIRLRHNAFWDVSGAIGESEAKKKQGTYCKDTKACRKHHCSSRPCGLDERGVPRNSVTLPSFSRMLDMEVFKTGYEDRG